MMQVVGLRNFDLIPSRFTQMRFVTDSLHIENNTSCLKSFRSTLYADMKVLNKEACEQFNSLLRSIQKSVTYMDLESYLLAMKIFVPFHNVC